MLKNNSLYQGHIHMAPPLFLDNCKQVITNAPIDFISLK